MRTKFAIGTALALAMGFAATANAGLHSVYPITVGQYIAYGSMHSARVNAGNKEFIGCAVMGNTQSTSTTYVACNASDATGKSFYCSKYNPSYQLITAATAASASSTIIINSNANYECTYIYVQNSSINL